MNELSIEIQTYASDTTTEKSAQVAIGLAAWLDSFWIPTQRRKYPLINFCLCDTRLCITSDDNCDSWTKLVSATLKKVIVEDLGNMNAVELLKTIPFNDSNSRGLENLQELAKALQVKVVFCENGRPEGQIFEKVLYNQKHFVALPLETVRQGNCLSLVQAIE